MYEPFNQFDRRDETQNPVYTTYRMVDEVEKPVKKRHTGLKITALCLCCALLGGAAAMGANTLMNRVGPKGQTTIYHGEHTPVAVTVANVPSATALTPAQVYAANVDSCVGITVSTTTNVFGYTTTAAATGSGFVITEDGYIVTNHHVIEEATRDKNVPITVSFQNGESYKAKLVGSEADNDVAVLKIEAQGLKPVVLGDSDKLVVGESVYAIGNPLGELTYSLTDGIVSALDRVITTGSGEDAVSLNMLQTNCAINSGNSGGPLFNAYGEVIGITTAKMSGASASSATIEGLGFAVPVNDVKDIIKDLIENGYVTGKPYMGVQISSVTEADAKRYGLKVGAYVEVVEENSSAAKAGLKVGDIIIAIDETEINTHSALVATVATYRAGDTVTLKIMREHKEMELKLTFAERQPTDPQGPQEVEKPASQQQTPQQQTPNSGQGGSYYYQWPFGSFFNFPF
ncbi:MAG: trypsin-like serine protease [Ruminococcaceae bacterium]|nr:trypsin-like serine protease [Oscillospiraceae bacterium]